MNKSLCFVILFYIPILLEGFSKIEILPQKVLICGVCKDIEDKLPYSKKIVESIGALFNDYRVLLYENNSTDATAKFLMNWAKKNPKVFVESEFLTREKLAKSIINITNDGQFFRPEAIARARNIILDMALSTEYTDFPYIIWMDMDFTVFPELEGIIEVFQTDQEWDAVFANGIDPDNIYWDWYACRYGAFPFGPELLGMKWFRMHKEREKDLVLTKNSKWFPVYSAFGGCGIYKKSSIEGCRYSGIVTEDMEKLARRVMNPSHTQTLLYLESVKNLKKVIKVNLLNKNFARIEDPDIGIVLYNFPNPIIWKMNTFTYQYPSVCEHVPFHASMIIRGHDKLFINPRLVFRY